MKTGESGGFLGVAFPDTGMQILPYHRAIKDLNGRSPDAFLARSLAGDGASGRARRGSQGRVRDVFAGFSGGRDVASDRARRRAGVTDPVASLDVQRLHNLVLAPVLGIGDERTTSGSTSSAASAARQN